MLVLTIIVSIFLALELANVLALYFHPDTDKFNALGVFKAWEASKEHPPIHDLVRYLAWWVAGTKLIFISLMIAILAYGDARLRVIAVGALVLSILSFFWRLFPLIRRMDRDSQLTSGGYSKVLGLMIAAFVLALAVAGVTGMLESPSALFSN